jgi:hypothetical protein
MRPLIGCCSQRTANRRQASVCARVDLVCGDVAGLADAPRARRAVPSMTDGRGADDRTTGVLEFATRLAV